jgi:hypothetical protein
MFCARFLEVAVMSFKIAAWFLVSLVVICTGALTADAADVAAADSGAPAMRDAHDCNVVKARLVQLGMNDYEAMNRVAAMSKSEVAFFSENPASLNVAAAAHTENNEVWAWGLGILLVFGLLGWLIFDLF